MANTNSRRRRDIFERGTYAPTPWGRALFVGLRLLEPFIQYSILTSDLRSKISQYCGGTVDPYGAPVSSIPAPTNALRPWPHAHILLAMSITSLLKQNHWVLFLSNEPMPPPLAIRVAVLNVLLNSINSLLFIWSTTCMHISSDASIPDKRVILGCTLYLIGIFLEWASEVERKNFKRKPENKGKPCTKGFWRLARHINYGGFIIWRCGYAIYAAGWTWGATIGIFFWWNFTSRAVPVLEEYCAKKVSNCRVLISASGPDNS